MTINFKSPETERAWRQAYVKNFLTHGERARMASSFKRRKPLKHKHPVLVELFHLLDSERVFMRDVCKRAGVTPNAVGKWRNGTAFPKLYAIESMLAVLGHELRVAKKKG